jgi:hypothetical protein
MENPSASPPREAKTMEINPVETKSFMVETAKEALSRTLYTQLALSLEIACCFKERDENRGSLDENKKTTNDNCRLLRVYSFRKCSSSLDLLFSCYDSTEERSYNETRSDGPESDGSQHCTHSFSIVSSDRVPGIGVITDEPPSSGQPSFKTPSAGKKEIWRGGAQGLDLIYHTQDASVQNVSIRPSHTVNGYSSNGYTSNGDTSIESSFASFNFSSGDGFVTKQNRPSDTSNAGANGGYSSTGESSSIENSLQSRQSPTFVAGEQTKKISHLSDRVSFPTKRSPVDSNHNNTLISRLRPRFRPRPKYNSMESQAI